MFRPLEKSHRRPGRGQARSRQKGVSLIEVMVAIVVLSIGLFGIVWTQLNSIRSQRGAHLRATAVQMASDMAERMRLNTDAMTRSASNYADPSTNKYTTLVGKPLVALTAKPAFADAAAQATHDLAAWRSEIARRMGPGTATGVVRAVTGEPMSRTVVVMWQERLPTKELSGVATRGNACEAGDGANAQVCDPGCPSDGTVNGAPIATRCVQIGVQP